jgi:hypothetical protein
MLKTVDNKEIAIAKGYGRGPQLVFNWKVKHFLKMSLDSAIGKLINPGTTATKCGNSNNL